MRYLQTNSSNYYYKNLNPISVFYTKLYCTKGVKNHVKQSGDPILSDI